MVIQAPIMLLVMGKPKMWKTASAGSWGSGLATLRAVSQPGSSRCEHTLPQGTDKEAADNKHQENDQKPDNEREGTAQAAPLSH